MPLLADLLAFRTNSKCKDVYVLGADATGDVPHLAAAMKKYTAHAVVIFEWGTSLAAGPKRSLLALNVPEARVHIVTAAQLTAAAGEADAQALVAKIRAKNKSPRNEARDIVSGLCQKVKFHTLQLHTSTSYAADTLADDVLRKELHVDFRGPATLLPGDDRLLSFWLEKKVPYDHDLVVIWGRTSGKDKTVGLSYGPHPYGDSSITGLVQVAERCVAKGWTVVVAGDVAESKRDRFPKTSVFLGRFWKDPHWKGVPPTQKEQLRLFYILKLSLDDGKRLVHVGMRSGNLDYYAFAGQSIVYLVAAGFDDVRITELANRVKKRWHKTTPAQPPKRQYNTQWGDDWLRILKQTKLGQLLPQGADLAAQLAAFKDLYPADTKTELHAHLLYRSVKAAVGQSDAPTMALAHLMDDQHKAEDLLQAFYAERSARGFGDAYLLELMATIGGCLSGAKV